MALGGLQSIIRRRQGQASQGQTPQQDSRIGQTGALGMLSEKLSQGLAKKKKIVGQQNVKSQQGLTSKVYKEPGTGGI